MTGSDHPLHVVRRGKDFVDEMAGGVRDTAVHTGQWVSTTYNKANRAVRSFITNDLDEVIEKVSVVVFKTARLAVAILLFASNSSVFVISAVVGMSTPQWMKEQIDDIQTTWERIRKDKDYPLLGVVTTAAVLAWPITFAVGAFYLGGYYGILIKNPDILKLQPRQRPTQPVPTVAQTRYQGADTPPYSDDEQPEAEGL